ncbi:HAD family hydrolase [Anaeromyxobacter oryzae]|uniref:HAD family hydrolase n=1 Tax=Anaeromyxobacter oryzae TaxID=2918170 RepID=UPI0020C0DEF1|nr:HAD family hydrolase [Anaeromyxobacter oryzae]
MPRYRAVVTDLDNTLYPWVDFIVPALEAMVDSLVATTALPRVRIVQSLKAVYSKYESNEYPFAIQESEIFRPYEADFDSFNALVLEPARHAFATARDRYLQPYPLVRETLDRIRGRGLRVVGLTDAPRNAAELRLKHLKLDGHFDALYTLPRFPLPENVAAEIRRKEEAGHYRSRTPVFELPREAEKPDASGLRKILADLGLDGREVLYVGDNVKKDMPVAEACGALGVWAEYGTYVSKEYRDRLAVISAKKVTQRHVADESQARWPLAISSFAQVLDILDGATWSAPRAAARRGKGAR